MGEGHKTSVLRLHSVLTTIGGYGYSHTTGLLAPQKIPLCPKLADTQALPCCDLVPVADLSDGVGREGITAIDPLRSLNFTGKFDGERLRAAYNPHSRGS